MRGAVLFVVGVFVGSVLLQPGFAQNASPRGVNHVGIVVKDYDAALSFYTKTMGLREAYTMRVPTRSTSALRSGSRLRFSVFSTSW